MGGRNTCVCGTALPADLRWVGYAGPCRLCARPVIVEPPSNHTDPLLSNEGPSSTIRALVFGPLLQMDWFTTDTGAFYSNEWLVLQSDEKFQIFEIESSLNLLAQRYGKLKSGALHESRITRRWEVSKVARDSEPEEREREIARLERVADLIQTAVDENLSLTDVRPDPEHGRKRLQDRAEQIRRFVERLGTFSHLVDLFNPDKSSAWEGEPRYSGVSRVHDLRALRQIAAGRWQSASDELERAVRCDPEDPIPRQHRLLLGARLGRLEQAESDADWLAQRLTDHRAWYIGWRAYVRFCRDRLEEAKSDARLLWPDLEGDELAERMSELLREREESAHALHECWIAQFNIGLGPGPQAPPAQPPKPMSSRDVIEQALIEAAEMGGGRVLMGPSRGTTRDFMVVMQPSDGAGYWMIQAPAQDASAVTAKLRGETANVPHVRSQFKFVHRSVEHQIEARVKTMEFESDRAEFAELRVTPMRRGIDVFQSPATTARPIRTAVLGFLESGVSDAILDRLNSALMRGLTAFSSIPVVRGRTLAYAGITLNDASENLAQTLTKIRGEFNAERFIYARLDPVPETPDSGLRHALTLVVGDAWINHAESIRAYGIYDRSDLETAVELAAQDFARLLMESDLVPASATGPEFPPADPKRRVAWLKLLAGHHELSRDRARAVQYLREAAELDRADVSLKTALALALQASGDLEGASAVFREVAERQDEKPEPAGDRARTRLRWARVQRAQEDFRGAQESVLRAGGLCEDDAELASAVQRSLRALSLEAIEHVPTAANLFFLGHALGEFLLGRELAEEWLGRYPTKRLKAGAAAPALWLECDRIVGEDFGAGGRTVLRLGRLLSELGTGARDEWTRAGVNWLEWLLDAAPRMMVDGLGGRDALLALRERWKAGESGAEFVDHLRQISASRKAPPSAAATAQRVTETEWAAPHLEVAPLPELVLLDDRRLARLEDGRYRVGRAERVEEFERLEPGPYRGSGWFVSTPRRRGLVESSDVLTRLMGVPLEKLYVPPVVRVIFWKAAGVSEAPPMPDVLAPWLFEAGEDRPTVSSPWIALPSGPPRGWRCREAWGEFLPESILRFRSEPVHFKRKEGVYALLFFPIFGM